MTYHLPFPFSLGPEGSPPPELSRRLHSGPLDPVTLPSGDIARLVVRHEDVKQVLADLSFTRALTYPGAPRMAPVDQMDLADLGPGMIFNLDPPQHTRLRGVIAKAVTPRLVAAWRPRLRAAADRLIDELIAGDPHGDLAVGLTTPWPIVVMCELYEIPEQDRPRVFRWVTGLLLDDRLAGDELFAYMSDLLNAHRGRHGAGLTDALLAAADASGADIDDIELVLLMLTLFNGGLDNTASVLSRGVLALLTHPDRFHRLVADPALIPAAVEEILRYYHPADGTFIRVAQQDVTLPSGTIGKGETVLPSPQAANLDPATIAHPDRFDPGRDLAEHGNHLAFGHGAHHCVGAHLARAELDVAINTLTRRLPHLRLAVPADEVEQPPRALIRKIKALPVRWDAPSTTP